MDGRTTNRRAWGVVQATNVSVSFKDKETDLYTPLYKGLHKLIMNAKRVTVVELYILPHIKQWGCMKEGAIPPLPINI